MQFSIMTLFVASSLLLSLPSSAAPAHGHRPSHEGGKGSSDASSSSSASASESTAASTSSGSSSGGTYTGQATWFEVGLGACGYTDTDADFIVALDSPLYESGNYCNLYLTVTNTENGKSATAQVRDECPSCAYGSLDMSPSLFESLAEGGLDEGVFPISWSFNS